MPVSVYGHIDVDEVAKAIETARPSSAPSSPLAGMVPKGFSTLTPEEFQAKKQADNAARLAIRERNNILLPAVCAIFLAYATFVGEDTFKAQSKAIFEDPFANAPGITEARERKQAMKAKAAEERAEMLAMVRG